MYKIWSIGLNTPGAHGMGVVAARTRERAMEIISEIPDAFGYRGNLFLEKEFPIHADGEYITMDFYIE